MKPCWKLVGSQRARTDAARIDVWFHEGHESKDNPVEYDHDEPMISLRAVEGISSQEVGTEAESILMLSEARRLAGGGAERRGRTGPPQARRQAAGAQ